MNRLALSVVLLACAASANAATQTVYLADLANGGPGTPFGTEPNGSGHVKPSAGATAAPGFGTSSFAASIDAATLNRYSNFRVNGSALGTAVTVADLDNFSYWTNTSGQLDWRISIYTKQTGSTIRDYNPVTNPNGNLGSFYKSRIQAFPASDNNAQWNQLTDGALSFGETNLSGNQSTPWSWADIQAGTVVAGNGNSRDFRSEEILFIDFTLGANNGGGISQGELDGIVFTIGSNSLSLNLEAVIPLPTSSMMGLGLLSAGLLGRRR